jgi:hypothetical protein
MKPNLRIVKIGAKILTHTSAVALVAKEQVRQ